MESGGITSVSKQFDVRKMDDIIALIALYRLGPMELIGDYIKRKKGLTKIQVRASAARGNLRRYLWSDDLPGAGDGGSQQTGRLFDGAGGFAAARHGQKGQGKDGERARQFHCWLRGTNEIGEKKANAIFDLLEKFAGYGFNKSHSAAYALISYQTAFLKANHPVEFMAGLLSNEINNTEKISVLVSECKRMGITICHRT